MSGYLKFIVDDGMMLCPNRQCQFNNYTHIDECDLTCATDAGLHLSASGEDESSSFLVKNSDKKETGRRHTFTLTFTCEGCGTYEYSFKQHKGRTMFDITKLKPRDQDEEIRRRRGAYQRMAGL